MISRGLPEKDIEQLNLVFKNAKILILHTKMQKKFKSLCKIVFIDVLFIDYLISLAIL